jgi:hypothetical protein
MHQIWIDGCHRERSILTGLAEGEESAASHHVVRLLPLVPSYWPSQTRFAEAIRYTSRFDVRIDLYARVEKFWIQLGRCGCPAAASAFEIRKTEAGLCRCLTPNSPARMSDSGGYQSGAMG